jgi:hypothetical protein
MGQMLCHGAGDLPPEQAREVICQGWVRVLGLDAIGVRIAVMRGAVTDEELEDTDRPDLFDSLRRTGGDAGEEHRDPHGHADA